MSKVYDINDNGEATLTGNVPDITPGSIVISADNLISQDGDNALEAGSDSGILLKDETVFSVSFDIVKSIDPIPVALPVGYNFARVDYYESTGSAATLTMDSQYVVGSQTIGLTKVDISTFAGHAVEFQTNITGGNEATFSIRLFKN
jgi:hypothetical protein